MTLLFQIFYFSHLLYIIFWIFLLMHGPIFWIFFIVPGLVLLVEKIGPKLRKKLNKSKFYIIRVNLLPSKASVMAYFDKSKLVKSQSI